MYTSLLKSLTLDELCQMTNHIDLYGAAYVDPEITVKSELVESLNEHFEDYPEIFHDIKMKYFSVHGQPVHREDLILVENVDKLNVVLRELHSNLPYIPVPEDVEVFEEVYCFDEEDVFQPTGNFSLTQYESIDDEEFNMTVKWLPLGSTRFISYHDLALLN